MSAFNAFEGPSPAPPPTLALLLGLVPMGYLILAEVALRIETAALAALSPGGGAFEFIPQAATAFSVSALLEALATGEVDAIVDFGVADRLHRIPRTCWASVAEEFRHVGMWADPRFLRILQTGCAIGPEFGIYGGKTPCIATNGADRLAARCSGLFQPDSLTNALLGGAASDQGKRGEQALNVPIGHMASSNWVVLPEVGAMAATRLRNRGEPEHEKAVRVEIAKMLTEHNKRISPQSIAARRNDAGFKLRD